MSAIGEPPVSLKSIQTYLKTASEHDNRDIIVAYWCRLYGLQVGLKVSTKQPEEQMFLLSVMDWLETFKKAHKDNESITNEVAAQAYLENYALKLFLYADKQDRESNFGKNVVKAFFTAGVIYDCLLTFGELTDEVQQNRKYAKWKAAYIHNCLKNGETPVPGPMKSDDDEYVGGQEDANDPGPSAQPPPTMGFLPNNPAPPSDHADPFQNVQLPMPPKEPEKPPGGFVPYHQPAQESETTYTPPSVGVNLTAEQIAKAQKYCKWAGSALNYDDIKTAIENLQKGLRLLQTGQDH